MNPFGMYSCDEARNLMPGDVMTEYGEVVSTSIHYDAEGEAELVEVVFLDRGEMFNVVFHMYEDVELSVT